MSEQQQPWESSEAAEAEQQQQLRVALVNVLDTVMNQRDDFKAQLSELQMRVESAKNQARYFGTQGQSIIATLEGGVHG